MYGYCKFGKAQCKYWKSPCLYMYTEHSLWHIIVYVII